jgi:hypothetical protein
MELEAWKSSEFRKKEFVDRGIEIKSISSGFGRNKVFG